MDPKGFDVLGPAVVLTGFCVTAFDAAIGDCLTNGDVTGAGFHAAVSDAGRGGGKGGG